jgi:RimJ/RimL family protein N-acetyltransferase
MVLRFFSRIPGALRAFKDTWSSDGGLKAFKKAWLKLIKPVFYLKTSIFLTRRFDKPFPPPNKACPNFILSIGTIEDLLSADFIEPQRHKYFRYNEKIGAQCCIGRVDGRIISFDFMTTQPYRDPISSIVITPENGQVYQFDGAVRPSERGKAYGFHHSAQYNEMMFRKGYREAICLVDFSNKPSWNLHLRMGFEPRKKCRQLRFFGKLIIARWSPCLTLPKTVSA